MERAWIYLFASSRRRFLAIKRLEKPKPLGRLINLTDIPDGMTLDEFKKEWDKTNGVIIYRNKPNKYPDAFVEWLIKRFSIVNTVEQLYEIWQDDVKIV